MDAVARLLVWLGLITSNRSNRGQTCPRFEGSRLLVVKERGERRVKMREARREI